MTIFEIYGGNAPNSVAAYGNGITLGILGKSLSTLVLGHIIKTPLGHGLHWDTAHKMMLGLYQSLYQLLFLLAVASNPVLSHFASIRSRCLRPA